MSYDPSSKIQTKTTNTKEDAQTLQYFFKKASQASRSNKGSEGESKGKEKAQEEEIQTQQGNQASWQTKRLNEFGQLLVQDGIGDARAILSPSEYQQIYNSVRFNSIPNEIKAKAIQEETRIFWSKRAGNMGTNNGHGQKGNFRGGSIGANSNAIGGPSVRAPRFTLKVADGSKFVNLKDDNGSVGIAHSMSGELNKLEKLTNDCMINTMDEARFAGHHILTPVVTGSVAPGRGAVTYAFPLNPRAWLDTRLGQASLQYETFMFNHVKIRYVPSCPTTTTGAITLFFNPDCDQNGTLQGGIQSLNNAEEYKGTVTDSVWKAIELGVSGFQSNLCYTEMSSDNKWTYAGVLHLMFASSPPANTDLGLLYLEYDCSFHKRVLNPIRANVQKSGSVSYSKTVSPSILTNFDFQEAQKIAGSAPPANSKYVACVYEATNFNLLNFYDFDSGTNPYSIGTGAMLFGYSGTDATTIPQVFSRKMFAQNSVEDRLQVVSNSGTPTITFSYTWYVVADI
jgi:hypothetical protein